MESGITPEIHDVACEDTPSKLPASMEPGITPGIHAASTVEPLVGRLLQWGPGSLPGYTSWC